MIDFPNSPAPNTEFTAPDGRSWKWDGAAWLALSNNVTLAAVATTGSYNNLTDLPTLGTAAATDASAYAASSHTHPLSQLQQSSATNGQVPTWNGTAWTPQTPSGGGSGSSVVSNTTGMTGASQLTNIVQITQAGYNAIATPNASTLYIIVG